MRVYTSLGDPLDATFSVEHDGETVSVFFESRGPGRNVDYHAGLETLLRRVSDRGASILAAELASQATAALTRDERSLRLEGHPYPIDLSRLNDVAGFRRALTSAQAETGRAPGAKGPGNPTKRIMLELRFPSGPPEGLEASLAGLDAHAFWAFLAHPETYDVEGAAQDLDTDEWLTEGKPIRKGDLALIWKAKGNDERRGIVALGEVLSDPRMLDDSTNPYWRVKSELAGNRERVRIRYRQRPALPLWVGSPGNELLDELSVARARGGSVFYLTPAQWDTVLERTGAWQAETEGEDLVEDVVRPKVRGKSQGTGLDAPSRKAVELRAMRVAEEHYGARWTRIEDMSANAPYDLLCLSDNNELRVEVKGTTGAGEKVLLTHREVESARRNHPDTALFVVSGIQLDRTGPEPVASGGTATEILPWYPDDEALVAITYRHEIQKGE